MTKIQEVVEPRMTAIIMTGAHQWGATPELEKPTFGCVNGRLGHLFHHVGNGIKPALA